MKIGEAGRITVSEARGVLTGLAVIGVCLLLAISVDLGVPGQDLLSTLRFHIAAAILILPLSLLLLGARLRALVMFGLVALSLAQGAGIVLSQQQRRAAFVDEPVLASFRMLSFNVLNKNLRGADAAAYITGSDADVAVVLEADGLGTGIAAVAARYPYQLGCEAGTTCDLAIFSRTPLTGTRIVTLEGLSRPRLLFADTVIAGQKVTIVALHLTKPYFDTFAAIELEQARNWIAGLVTGPMVLAGDFNAAAWSNRVAAMADALALVPPPSYPATWPVDIAPFGVPIDNMFTGGLALIREIAATPEAFDSNHLGLMATVELY